MQIGDTITISKKEYTIIGKYQHPKSDNVLLTVKLPKGKKTYKVIVYPNCISEVF